MFAWKTSWLQWVRASQLVPSQHWDALESQHFCQVCSSWGRLGRSQNHDLNIQNAKIWPNSMDFHGYYWCCSHMLFPLNLPFFGGIPHIKIQFHTVSPEKWEAQNKWYIVVQHLLLRCSCPSLAPNLETGLLALLHLKISSWKGDVQRISMDQPAAKNQFPPVPAQVNFFRLMWSGTVNSIAWSCQIIVVIVCIVATIKTIISAITSRAGQAGWGKFPGFRGVTL